jgi:hypothetical protein
MFQQKVGRKAFEVVPNTTSTTRLNTIEMSAGSDTRSAIAYYYKGFNEPILKFVLPACHYGYIYEITTHELGHALGLEDLYIQARDDLYITAADGKKTLVDNTDKIMYGFAGLSWNFTNNKFPDGTPSYINEKDWLGITQIQKTAFSACYAPYTEDDLCEQADIIVKGKVKKVVGKFEKDNFPYSLVTLKVDDYMKDTSGNYLKDLTFTQDGNAQLQLQENSVLDVDDECMLFLKKTEKNSYIILGGPQGRYDLSSINGESEIINHLDKYKSTIIKDQFGEEDSKKHQIKFTKKSKDVEVKFKEKIKKHSK